MSIRMTGSDPHEISPRLHAKDPDRERFLAQFNDWIAGMPLDASADDGDRLPLIYIVGAPRSGTTLVSQLISKYLDVGYINNLIARFWRRPLAGIRLSEICLGADARKEISLQSSYGVTSDIAGPHEFGYFWRQWLGLDHTATHHLTAPELERVDVDGLGRVLRSEVLGGFRRPTVFKNVICGFQAPLLTSVHPRSLFIHVTRDRFVTAASILAARHARYGTYDAWWSLKPSTFDEIRGLGSPAEQVARQVRDCREEFAAALSAPGVHHIEVAYESLCRSPREQLARVCDAVRPLG
ncbi:MAG: sulfotransferase, partial [Alphaproteobacteria bacterium]|nr:sulfotransferase [Alphaproteobacteria bacterium]